MPLSPDLITNIAFGLVMFVVGVLAIWIVKWSTSKTIDASSRRPAHTGEIDPYFQARAQYMTS